MADRTCRQRPCRPHRKGVEAVKRGTIYWVNLGTTHPPELGKTRPGIVVSNTEHNSVLDSVVIIPLSTQPEEIWPLRVDAGVHAGRPSFAVLPGIRQVSKTRLGQQLSYVDDRHMACIDGALTTYLSD